jgi:hypothetical protein
MNRNGRTAHLRQNLKLTSEIRERKLRGEGFRSSTRTLRERGSQSAAEASPEQSQGIFFVVVGLVSTCFLAILRCVGALELVGPLTTDRAYLVLRTRQIYGPTGLLKAMNCWNCNLYHTWLTAQNIARIKEGA